MNTTLSLGSGVGKICFLAGNRWAMSVAKYLASRSSLTFPSITEEVIHLPCALDPDMARVFFGRKKIEAWALELEDGWAEEEEGVG